MPLVELLIAVSAVVLGIVALLGSDPGIGLIGLVVGGVAVGLVLSRVCGGTDPGSPPKPRQPPADDCGAP
jgi:hypothetical protein